MGATARLLFASFPLEDEANRLIPSNCSFIKFSKKTIILFLDPIKQEIFLVSLAVFYPDNILLLHHFLSIGHCSLPRSFMMNR